MYLRINLARGENANRITISAWVLAHYQEFLPNTYDLWLKDNLGQWVQGAEGHTIEQAVEFARRQLPGKPVIRPSLWPQLDSLDSKIFKTEFREKVFDL